MSDSKEPEKPRLKIRPATIQDAAAIWELVREIGVLDLNSAYLYLLLCRDFADTCLVAEGSHGLAGFVTAYHPPDRTDVLFIWQVGISQDARRQGLAGRLLQQLIAGRPTATVRYIEATVSPSNLASRRLFDSLAAQLGAPLTESESDGFAKQHFPAGDHEPEPLIRIGPLPIIDPDSESD
ncbi:MAG: diaminobutyrate acetyltransferase [Fuerstiella sp.]